MPSLLRASFAVGLIGLIAAVPFFMLLGSLHREAVTRIHVPAVAVAVVFGTAASLFLLCYSLLPASRFRARAAGVLASLLTYALVGTIYLLAVSLTRGRPFPEGALFVILGFLTMGWIPVAAGLFAGWWVERRRLLPASDAADGSPDHHERGAAGSSPPPP